MSIDYLQIMMIRNVTRRFLLHVNSCRTMVEMPKCALNLKTLSTKSIDAPNQTNLRYTGMMSTYTSRIMHRSIRVCSSTSGNDHSSVIFDVKTENEFDKLVLQSKTPVLVDFHADWCGPCKSLGPRLESIVAGRDGAVHLARVNVDMCADLAMNYEVQAVPTVIAFKAGNAVDRFVGDKTDKQLARFIDQLAEIEE